MRPASACASTRSSGARDRNSELLRLRPQLGPRLSVRRRRGAAAAARHDPPRDRLLRQHAGEQERRRPAQLVGPRPPLDRQHEHPHHAGRVASPTSSSRRRSRPGASAEAEARPGRAGMPAVRASRRFRRLARSADGRSSSEGRRRSLPLRMALLAAIAASAGIGLATPRCADRPRPPNISPVYEGWVPNPDGSFNWSSGTSTGAGSGDDASCRSVPNNTIEPGGPGPGPADELLPAPQPFRLPCPGAEGLRHEGNRLDAHEQRPDRKSLRDAASPTTCSTTCPSCRTSARAAALSTTPDMVGNKAPMLTVEGPSDAHGEGRASRSHSSPSRPTTGSRTSGRCRPRSAATTRCRTPPTACASRTSSTAGKARA